MTPPLPTRRSSYLVRRCREISPLRNHPGHASRQRLSGLRERFHANRRNAIDQDLEAIVTHDIAADTIDLLLEHPWLGSEMTLHQRARRWIEEDEFALRRHASPIDEKSPVRQGMRREIGRAHVRITVANAHLVCRHQHANNINRQSTT